MKAAIWVRALARRAASLSLVVIVLGCSSSSDSSPPSSSAYHSRVDESKALGALSADEQRTLCQDVASWTAALTTPESIAGSCNLTAISAASNDASFNHLTVDQMRAACHTAEAQCMSDHATMMQMMSSRGCAYPTTCSATVADLRDCTVGTAKGQMDLYATLPSCDAVQLDTTSKIDYSLETKAAAVCTKVTACGLPT